jgi:hypothetical protein
MKMGRYTTAKWRSFRSKPYIRLDFYPQCKPRPTNLSITQNVVIQGFRIGKGFAKAIKLAKGLAASSDKPLICLSAWE